MNVKSVKSCLPNIAWKNNNVDVNGKVEFCLVSVVTLVPSLKTNNRIGLWVGEKLFQEVDKATCNISSSSLSSLYLTINLIKSFTRISMSITRWPAP